MYIRDAEIEDIKALVELGEDMHAESPRFSPYRYLQEKLFDLTYNLIESPDGIVLVAEDGEQMVGMMLGFTTEFFFSDAKYASDIVLYVVPEKRGSSAAVRLVNEFRMQARERGAAEFVPGTSTGVEPERTKKFYEAMGCEALGYSMRQVL